MDALKQRLTGLFVFLVLGASAFMLYNWYADYRFNTSPLPPHYLNAIDQKKREVMANVFRHYGLRLDVPMIVSDKMKGRLYGLTAYNGRDIVIYLNKKRMKESFDYMVDDVIAHEYAHALMFATGSFERHGDGHSPRWLKMCQKLGGHNCAQYVNGDDIVMGKLPF
jgi:predicted SprT family Zn-dependent metalloprotease